MVEIPHNDVSHSSAGQWAEKRQHRRRASAITATSVLSAKGIINSHSETSSLPFTSSRHNRRRGGNVGGVRSGNLRQVNFRTSSSYSSSSKYSLDSTAALNTRKRVPMFLALLIPLIMLDYFLGGLGVVSGLPQKIQVHQQQNRQQRAATPQETEEDKTRAAYYAKRLVKCQESQGGWSGGDGTEMASCLKDLVLSVAPRLRDPRGLPELELPRVDPFDLQKVTIDGERGFSGNFTNLRLHGVTKGLTAENLNIVVNPKNLRADLSINIPSLRLEGDFDMSINFVKALFPWLQGFQGAKSSGRINADFAKVEARGLGLFKEAATGTGRLGVFLQRVGIDFDFHEGNFTFQSNDPRDPIIPLLQGILNDRESGKVIVNEIKPEVIQVVNKVLYNLMSKGVQNIDRLLYTAE